MSVLGSNGISLCEACGDLVWWDRIEKHDAWYDRAAPAMSLRDVGDESEDTDD